MNLCSFLQVNFEQVERVREAGGAGGGHAAVVPPADALYLLASVIHVDEMFVDEFVSARSARDDKSHFRFFSI